MKEFVKGLLKSSRVGRMIYPFIQRIYKYYSIPHRRRLLQKQGLTLLRMLDDVLSRNHIDYYVEFGTLLGVVRENGFIKTDDDIDLMISNPTTDPKAVLELLVDQGMHFIHALTYRGKIRILAFSWKGLSVDFYFRDYAEDGSCFERYGVYYDSKRNYPDVKCNSCLMKRYDLKFVPERRRFKEIEISVPRFCEEYLDLQYGPGWRIPDPNHKTAAPDTNIYMNDYAPREMDLDYVRKTY